ncbi:hypothetical protein GCM10009634_12560 [Saccharothrix xinjiangensis]
MAEKITAQTSFVVLADELVLVSRSWESGCWARDDDGPRVDATLTVAKPNHTMLTVISVINT